MLVILGRLLLCAAIGTVFAGIWYAIWWVIPHTMSYLKLAVAALGIQFVLGYVAAGAEGLIAPNSHQVTYWRRKVARMVWGATGMLLLVGVGADLTLMIV